MVVASSKRQWKVAQPADQARQLQRELNLHPKVAQILCQRGYADPEVARHFLQPKLKDLRDPKDLADIDLAVGRLLRAIERGEIIGVFGDYDVDGVTSTALLTWFLAQAGAKVVPYIPHRLHEGYGLGIQGIENLAKEGAKLIVSVDCGITAHVEIAAAADLGIDVVVVDHHSVGESLPGASAVLNPHRRDCQFSFNALAAVGVTFFLCAALRRELRNQGLRGADIDLRQGLDLVALGTVADQVPLLDQNRILVSAGLKRIQQGGRAGVDALCDVAGIDRRFVHSSTIAFQLAPRINAAGRLGDPMVAVQLLLTEDKQEAHSLSLMLDTINSERRRVEREVFEQACQQLEEMEQIPQAIVLCGEWHSGVVGIVASRLVDRFGRPTILIGAEGKGSGRSVPGFSLHGALLKCADLMIGFGGHDQAIGLRIAEDKVEPLRQSLCEQANVFFDDQPPVATLSLDASLVVGEIDLPLAKEVSRLEPFGRGNPEPIFVIDQTVFRSQFAVGTGHVRFSLGGHGCNIKGIAFNMSDRLEAGAFVDGAKLAAVLELDDWGGRQRPALRLIDIVAPKEPLEKRPDMK